MRETNRIFQNQTRQAKHWTKITLSDKAMPLPKSWQKKIKLHTITEPAILPSCCKIVNIIFGEGYEKEILKIPTSDDTICRRI
jgi:hypothetical protein